MGFIYLISELHIYTMASSQQQPANSSTRAKEARGQEGNRLEEDLIRLSGAEKVAKGKVAFWEQQTGRLGEQVVRTRASLGDQQRLVRKRKEEVEKAQRVLTLCQGELGKQEADLATMEGQLKVNEEAQRKARADCKV
jgi:phage-related tail protein